MQTVAFLLTLAVIFVNGWTDAPNAIAGCIATRALSPPKAVGLSALCNFLGVWVTSRLHLGVAHTVGQIAAVEPQTAAGAAVLCGALTAVAIWGIAAWAFGVPTSESHGLLAGLAGAGLAANKVTEGLTFAPWAKVLWGLFGSITGGFLLGFWLTKWVERAFCKVNRQKSGPFWDAAQIVAGAAMSFMHGAQDGQKFLGLLLLLLPPKASIIPLWAVAVCALGMGLGTSAGGYKIIKTVGLKMVVVQKHQGFCADLAGAISLLGSTLLSWPVSTTHTKTAALLGAGATKGLRSVHWDTVLQLPLAWVLTFPACGSLGYVATKIFLRFGG